MLQKLAQACMFTNVTLNCGNPDVMRPGRSLLVWIGTECYFTLSWFGSRIGLWRNHTIYQCLWNTGFVFTCPGCFWVALVPSNRLNIGLKFLAKYKLQGSLSILRQYFPVYGFLYEENTVVRQPYLNGNSFTCKTWLFWVIHKMCFSLCN